MNKCPAQGSAQSTLSAEPMGKSYRGQNFLELSRDPNPALEGSEFSDTGDILIEVRHLLASVCIIVGMELGG